MRRNKLHLLSVGLQTYSRRVTSAGIATDPGEAIPFLGVGILVAGTAYELHEVCDSMRDLDRFYAGLGMEDEVAVDLVRKACGVDSGPSAAQKDSEKFQSFFMMPSCN